MRPELDRLAVEIAGRRVPGTMGHRQPEAFKAGKRTALLPLPSRPFEPATRAAVTVHFDGLIAFDGRFYSVPWPLVGQRVWMCVDAEDELVETHACRGEDLRRVLPEHPPGFVAVLLLLRLLS